MELVKKKELLTEFEVEASFYNVKLGDVVFECRNQARIKRKGFTTEKFDAIFILCNPGSCEPIMKAAVPYLDPRRAEAPFIRANSDQTQEQIMRLMKIKQWNQVNIINISDLCSGNLTDFTKILTDAENASFTYHSIFSDERREELLRILKSNSKGFVISGWGTNSIIKAGANKVLQHNQISSLIGWKHKLRPFYYHPNPHIYQDKKEWIHQTLESLEDWKIRNGYPVQ